MAGKYPSDQEIMRMAELPKYEVKDSGKREEFAGGMVRDTDEGKVRYDLALDGPMFERYAKHLTKGAEKYEARNWMKASGQEELERFRQSALRHFLQWFRGEVDEDHAAAVIFNINGAEYCRDAGAQPYEWRDNAETITTTTEVPKPKFRDGSKESPYHLVDSCKPGDFYLSPSKVLYQKMVDKGWYRCDTEKFQICGPGNEIVDTSGDVITPASKSEAKRINLQTRSDTVVHHDDFATKPCGDRLAHKGHTWGYGPACWCNGFNYDRT